MPRGAASEYLLLGVFAVYNQSTTGRKFGHASEQRFCEDLVAHRIGVMVESIILESLRILSAEGCECGDDEQAPFQGRLLDDLIYVIVRMKPVERNDAGMNKNDATNSLA